VLRESAEKETGMAFLIRKGKVGIFLLFFCFQGPVLHARASGQKTPVILSADIGNEIDDQWAIVYSLVNPDLNVLGIVSAHAPVLIPPAGRTGYMLLVDVVENRMGMVQHPRLFAGASFPLEDAKTPQPSPGADFIIEASKAFSRDNRLSVLTIGAVTDVASAILRDPTIVERIQIVDMGLRDWPAGGDDFNILNDVKAMQVIMDSDVPLIIGCAKVCADYLGLHLQQAKDMIGNRGPVGQWLWEEFEAWYYRFVKPMRKDDFSRTKVIWDVVVLAYVSGMTTQQTYPRPKLNDDASFGHPETKKTITWITSIDDKRMWRDFLEKLDAYQSTHAVGHETLFSRHTFMIP
jgi:purine nucleosidase